MQWFITMICVAVTIGAALLMWIVHELGKTSVLTPEGAGAIIVWLMRIPLVCAIIALLAWVNL